ncbi:hypothetical protein MBAV_002125 [Candidatus Magnetobacterium bavaricum]|uniref:Uncharacterized protein n=1 Tax=Candidatus Magnetobacterium bavaricum TaxID=29290 RepID=A0A0F3GY86_9BACT|nr:hypothetical protein MBAV_002125 [Candidatus Magnetobacterium bavaricum]
MHISGDYRFSEGTANPADVLKRLLSGMPVVVPTGEIVKGDVQPQSYQFGEAHVDQARAVLDAKARQYAIANKCTYEQAVRAVELGRG